MRAIADAWGLAVLGTWIMSIIIIDPLIPALFDGVQGAIVMGSVGVLIGVLADMAGLRGHVIGLPVWAWGLISMGVMLAYQLGESFVWPAAGVLLAMGPLYWFQKRRGGLPAAVEALDRAEKAATAGRLEDTWSELASAWRSPPDGELDPEVAAHAQRTLRALRKHMGAHLEAPQKTVLDAIVERLDGGGPKKLDPDTVAWIEAVLQSRGMTAMDAPDLDRL